MIVRYIFLITIKFDKWKHNSWLVWAQWQWECDRWWLCRRIGSITVTRQTASIVWGTEQCNSIHPTGSFYVNFIWSIHIWMVMWVYRHSILWFSFMFCIAMPRRKLKKHWNISKIIKLMFIRVAVRVRSLVKMAIGESHSPRLAVCGSHGPSSWVSQSMVVTGHLSVYHSLW